MSVRDLWDKLMTNPRVKGFVAENENKLKGIVVMIVLVSEGHPEKIHSAWQAVETAPP